MAVRVLESIHDIDAASWNALDLRGNPFVRHEFLAALEGQRCAHAGTGWRPAHLALTDASGKLAGAAPLYLKSHSWGEFIFDWSWANAYHRAGLEYYPKLVCTVPFTPATGPRLLAARDADESQIKQQLASALRLFCGRQSLSSAHVLFGMEADIAGLKNAGFLLRHSCQFHWHNRGYRSLDDFLRALRADKRKKLLRERRRVQEQGIEFSTLHGGEISQSLWETIFRFSAATFERHGHEHYLTPAFFCEVSQALPERIMVKLALHRGEPAAAAIFFVSDDTLYGRYWGSDAAYHSLHFEACYYQGIDYCIERGLQHFEPGTQGEHKVPRGFEPCLIASAHYIDEPRFRRAIADYVHEESAEAARYAEEMRERLPFHRDPAHGDVNRSDHAHREDLDSARRDDAADAPPADPS